LKGEREGPEPAQRQKLKEISRPSQSNEKKIEEGLTSARAEWGGLRSGRSTTMIRSIGNCSWCRKRFCGGGEGWTFTEGEEESPFCREEGNCLTPGQVAPCLSPTLQREKSGEARNSGESKA